MAVPDEQAAPEGEKPKAPSAAAEPDEGLIATIKKVVLDVISELDGDGDGKGEPETPKSEPKRDRDIETDFRSQVRAAVQDLERERDHAREHEELKKPPTPPQAETKSWRRSFWGE